LAKDPEDRLQSAKDLRNELRELKQELDSNEAVAGGVTTVPGAVRKWRFAVALAAVAAVAVIGTILVVRPLQDAGQRLNVGAFTRLTSQQGLELWPSLSPDGKSVAYASRAEGNWDIYLHRVGGQNPINLTKDSPADDTHPAFSPAVRG